MKIIYCIIIWLIFVQTSFAASDDKVELEFHILNHIRNPIPYPGYIEIIYLWDSNEKIILKEIILDWGNDITRIPLNETLLGIGDEYREFQNISITNNRKNLIDSDIMDLV